MIEHESNGLRTGSAAPSARVAGSSVIRKVGRLRLDELAHLPTLRLVADRVAQRVWSIREAVGFRRDLDLPFAAPAASIPIDIRELGPDELPAMLDPTIAGASQLDILECASRRTLWARHFGRCFVATAPDGRACFLQWLFDHRDNAALAGHFGDSFPVLQRDEALLEGAYTPAPFRGLKIMPAAMARIAEHAAGPGARYVHTFVGTENLPSLKGCVRAGFSPHQWRVQRLRLFGRHTRFGPLPATFAADHGAIFT
jgi:hypothetical protein